MKAKEELVLVSVRMVKARQAVKGDADGNGVERKHDRGRREEV